MKNSLILLSLLSLLAGCSALPRQSAVPEPLIGKANVVGMKDVRYLATDSQSDETRLDVISSLERVAKIREKKGTTNSDSTYFLALSGGGDNGAFGAGLLVGWTKTGTRPAFDLVTGISTGALIAPFAFLGSKYDDLLQHFYTQISAKQIAKSRGLYDALFGDAVADSAPLKALIEQYMTDQLIDEVANEYEGGRNLLIGTTNLDAGSSVIWNMGRLAVKRSPEARKLFREVILASTSLPGAFPPVMFDVEAEGKRYQELHVDGGATAQVILYPTSLDVGSEAKRLGLTRPRRLYVIRNARLTSEPVQVERRTTSIAGRAITSLITTQGVGDLNRLFLLARVEGMDFNLAYIPSSFDFPHPAEFDQPYMRALFDFGYQQAVNGYKWQKVPPELVNIKGLIESRTEGKSGG